MTGGIIGHLLDIRLNPFTWVPMHPGGRITHFAWFTLVASCRNGGEDSVRLVRPLHWVGLDTTLRLGPQVVQAPVRADIIRKQRSVQPVVGGDLAANLGVAQPLTPPQTLLRPVC